MRAADRRTLVEDLDLLAEHLKRVYAFSVQEILPPAQTVRLPIDMGKVVQSKVIVVKLSEEFREDMPYPPPKYLGHTEIRYEIVI